MENKPLISVIVPVYNVQKYVRKSVESILQQGYSKKAFTLRGLHFQEGEHAQAKLVSCLHGSIFNVAVDLRPGERSGNFSAEKQ